MFCRLTWCCLSCKAVMVFVSYMIFNTVGTSVVKHAIRATATAFLYCHFAETAASPFLGSSIENSPIPFVALVDPLLFIILRSGSKGYEEMARLCVLQPVSRSCKFSRHPCR